MKNKNILQSLLFFAIISLVEKNVNQTYAQSGNFVRTWEATAAETNPNNLMTLPLNNVREKTEYADGLGRPIQIVNKDASLVTTVKKDIVIPIEYDETGRQVKSYLPYATATLPGQFKTDAFTAEPQYINTVFGETPSYGLTLYDNSPLNRTSKTMLPGTNWAGSNNGVSYDYDVNLSIEKVHIWTIGYTAGIAPVTSPTSTYTDAQLFKNITTDENLKQVITYTDKSGNIILKKVQDKTGTALTIEHAGWLCTYYVYDDFGRQRFIIPPKAVAYLDVSNWVLSANVTNELCFSNEYDQRGRLIVKKSPGADPVYLVYDQRDRLVFSQDGNQFNQTPKKWMATLYDNLDRVTTTGLIDYASTRAALQSWVDNNTTNNGTNTNAIVSSAIPPQANLVVDSRSATQPPPGYTASTSITFTPPFTSLPGDNFVAQIDPTVQSLNNTVSVNGNPLPTGNNLYTLTLTFYDDYSYTGAKTFSNNFTIDNTVPANEVQAVQQSLQTTDFVTGTKVRLLDGSNTFLGTTSFYDDKGRAIQLQGDNHKGFTDETTTQYDFSGKVRSTYEFHRFDGNNDIKIYTHNTYDLLGRIIKIGKSINGSSEKDIASYTYNELGQLANKKLAPGFAGEDGPRLESLDYTYNIQGWLLGINKAYSASATRTGNYFGMELGYDKAGTPGFTSTQTNGNIAGNAWKTRGDNTIRKYDYTYDNANQLLNAGFNQRNTPGAGWTIDKMNFTSNFTYDENGNITAQNQWGIVPGLAPLQIDQQIYHYDLVVPGGWTNKLSNIDERVSLFSNGNLGDFKNGSAGAVSQQYWYDKNANLSRDLNKEIGNSSVDGTQYNFMNLPTLITFKNTNKTIAIIYDAAGNKVRKILDEPVNGTVPARHVETDYDENFVYETIPVNLGGTGIPVLQFFAHEEGRVRSSVVSGQLSFIYDYFIKDHLSNVRMILTEEQKQDIYPAATLEGSITTDGVPNAIYNEQNFYTINTANVKDNSVATGITGYQNNNGIVNNNPNSNTTANSTMLYKLLGSANGGVTGLGITLKVMSGDKIDIFGKSYYFQNNTSGSNYNIPVLDILSGLLGAPTGAAAGKGATATGLNSVTGINTAVASFLNDPSRGGGATIPKAYINYILLDDNFNYVAGNFSRVGIANTVKSHYSDASMQNIPVTTNGYLYVYCSNQSPINVFFDNLQITHTRGRILEENNYYSYGLKIASISSKAAGSLQNKYLYQGDFSENDAETALEEFDLRHYDPQTGRWTTTDPYEQFASPYLGMGNNPMNFIDPSGGSLDNWIKYLIKEGNSTVEKVQWFDENFEQAKQIIEDLGGSGAEDLGLSGFWTSTEHGIQHWLLNSNGKSTLMDGLFTGIAPKTLAVLKEIPAPEPSFWQLFDAYNNISGNISSKVLFNTINDAYVTGKNYSQGHRGFLEDLNGDLVGSKERLSAGVNTFQLLMAPTDFALIGATNVAKSGGRLGNTATRNQIENIGTTLQSRGYTITGGGGREAEEFLKPLGGGRRGGSYIDITATHPNYPTLRINTVDVYKTGLPTFRESTNAVRIRTQIAPGEHLLLIPKK